jgi:hypothetical protein
MAVAQMGQSLSILLAVMMFTMPSCAAQEPQDIQLAVVGKIPTPSRIPPERLTAVRVIQDGSVCSATKVASNVILSAAHCYSESMSPIKVDETTLTVKKYLLDGNDHILVIFNEHTFAKFASIAGDLMEGDTIHYWGNPYIGPMLFRRGYYAGVSESSQLFDVNGYKGDSGTGIFNEDGKLVAVVSYVNSVEAFSMMGAYPLNFTEDQLLEAGMKPNKHLSTGDVAIVRMVH